jgi:hypothetical protein
MLKYNWDKLRNTDLNSVLTDLCHATEKGSRPGNNSRQFVTPQNHKIGVTGALWIDNSTQKGGHGAIDLLMYVKSINNREAAKLLNNFNPPLLNNIVNDNNQIVDYTIPDPCELTWSHVKHYLSIERKIPTMIIDDLHNKSLIWSDKNKNCVFPRNHNSGAFLRGTLVYKPFKLTIGKDGEPYIIPGNNLFIITEAPIDALSLKYYYYNATIISTGGRIGNHKILPYIANASEVYLAHDNDQSGNEQANNLYKMITCKVNRVIPPYNLKDWNEVLQYIFK